MLRAFLLTLLLVLPLTVSADSTQYIVSYNPYHGVDFGTVTKIQAQTHDHVSSNARIASYDTAGYDAIIVMDYSGSYQSSGGADNPDPGDLVGWRAPRRWPPEDHTSPFTDPSALTNVDFYVPGAEERGLSLAGSTYHMLSLFVKVYMEGWGCDSCSDFGHPVAQSNLDSLPDSLRYTTDAEKISIIQANDGFAIMNHPTGADTTNYTQFTEQDGIEFYNNFFILQDTENADTVFRDLMMAAWEAMLENVSTKVWGFAVNDHWGAYTALGAQGDSRWPATITATHIDRGKLQVLANTNDLLGYESAIRRGAFFAIEEDNATKNLYPDVTGITYTPGTSIAITTTAGTETVSWITNSVTHTTGFTLTLADLPLGLKYVRAEVADGAGRILYTQPFTLTRASRVHTGTSLCSDVPC